MNFQEHWNNAYLRTEREKLGWFETAPEPSLSLIESLNLSRNAAILDVGSGTGSLIPSLLKKGYNSLTATDISDIALKQADELIRNLGFDNVRFVRDDISDPVILRNYGPFDLWHDRTVLHFMTTAEQRKGYLATLNSLLAEGGYALIAVFAPEGAKKCSGLETCNYDADMLRELLGEDYSLIKSMNYLYIQPSGGHRPFTYTLFRKNF
jgi:SAM-dependent methyltransferase